MLAADKKIGLLGGTFDPVHNGHIELARNACIQKNLDEVWLMVSPDPPHKKCLDVTGFCKRFEMVRLSAEDSPFLVPSDYETRLSVPSYTAKTLSSLKKDFPNVGFFFIIGEDSLSAIETWYHPEEIMRQTELIVSVRNEGSHIRTITDQAAYLQRKYGAEITILDCGCIDISSTFIRQKVRAGESIKGLVPSKVEEYIWTENLYTR